MYWTLKTWNTVPLVIFSRRPFVKQQQQQQKKHGILYSAAQFIKILSYKILHVPESFESIYISNIVPENW